MHPMSNDYLAELQRRYGKPWPHIEKAARDCDEQMQKLSACLTEDGALTSSDTDIVVFGSLARGEWTSGSDVDWTLLIDGQADPAHRRTAQLIEDRLSNHHWRKPGAAGTFGEMTFSHDLIHFIGGQDDTNANTTRRILLLLESRPLRLDSSVNGHLSAHERVVRHVLHRYLSDDSMRLSPKWPESGVPRFLLNDIVRFWRTMCVDFACKQWEQAGQKWALRNIKLRMSRKLIFASGLLLCAAASMCPSFTEVSHDLENESMPRFMSDLLDVARMTPLQIVGQVLIHNAERDTAVKMLDAYDGFLAVLNDEAKRRHLEQLCPAKAYNDTVFNDCRDMSHDFQAALTQLFFHDDARLRAFTMEYGVF